MELHENRTREIFMYFKAKSRSYIISCQIGHGLTVNIEIYIDLCPYATNES